MEAAGFFSEKCVSIYTSSHPTHSVYFLVSRIRSLSEQPVHVNGSTVWRTRKTLIRPHANISPTLKGLLVYDHVYDMDDN
jgi:hypothetical protein